MLDKVFSNVEKKLKLIAKINFVCGIICVVLFAILGILGDGLAGLLVGLLAGALFLLSVAIIAWFVYAFAELVENTKEIKRILKISYAATLTEAERQTQAALDEQRRQQEAEEALREMERREKEAARAARIDAYWSEHQEERDALLEKRAAAEEKLVETGFLAGKQRETLQNLIQSIDEEFEKDREA